MKHNFPLSVVIIVIVVTAVVVINVVIAVVATGAGVVRGLALLHLQTSGHY